VLWLRCYERISIENRRVFSNEVSLTPNFRYKESFPTNHSSCRKSRINVLLYGIRMWARVSFVLSQCTRLTEGQTYRRTDRRTDGQKGLRDTVRYITCSRTVKMQQLRMHCTLRPSDVSPVVPGWFFCKFCTAHAQKLLFRSFRSKFWHHHWMQRSRLTIRKHLIWQ